ncbi:MAG: protein kinase [Verrucomicrobia bacterium]|nr:protein kinase [Verrucomicrobiota bacterium]
MNTETSINRCPKCGATVPAEAPQGLCPKCVLLGAATPTEAGRQERRRIEPPPLATVAAAFPQLEIIELIGHGGMGIVYKARQPRLDRFVALKLLPEVAGKDPTFAERFNREARVLAKLNHPNIVTVFDFGQSGGFFYLLMELVDGVNLRQVMRAGKFSAAEALNIVPKICDALQFAHSEGILHRDIKPENILLDTKGRVKIADFGIAKLIGDATPDITLTASGAALGTPHYMAPEQLEKPQEVDHRADIYSLGVVFYEMLTGELPIGRFAAPSTKTPLDERVDEIVFRALATARELRQQSAGQMKTEVEHVQTTSATQVMPSADVPAQKSSTANPSAKFEWQPEHRSLALGGLGFLLLFLLTNLLPAIGITLRVLGSMARQNVGGALLALALIAAPFGLGWWIWRRRGQLLAPLGLAGRGDSTGGTAAAMERWMHRLAVTVLLTGVAFAGCQVTIFLSAITSTVSSATGGAGSGIAALLALAMLAVTSLALNEKHAVASFEPTPGPAWMRSVGTLYLVLGGLAFLPSLLTWGSPQYVWNTVSTSAFVGLALLTRSNSLRRLAIAVCSAFSLIGVGSLIFIFGAWISGSEPTGKVAELSSPLTLGIGFLQWIPMLLGVWILCHHDVRPAFGLALSQPDRPKPNPWPHRLLWLVLALVLLPAAAVVASLLVPVFYRVGFGQSAGLLLALLPMFTGGLLVWRFTHTRPTAAATQPPGAWNPWPQRIFWALLLLVVVPVLVLALGLVLPRWMASRQLNPPVPMAATNNIPNLGEINSANQAATFSFTVPNAQVAIFTPVFWSNGVPARVPNLGAFAIAANAPLAPPMVPCINWERGEPPGGFTDAAWKIIVASDAGGDASSGGILMPPGFDTLTNAGPAHLQLNANSATTLWLARTNASGFGVSLEAECRDYTSRDGEILITGRLGTGTNWMAALGFETPATTTSEIANPIAASANSSAAPSDDATRRKQDIQIRMLRERLAEESARVKVGVLAPLDVAKTERDLAIAEARGDAVKIAEANLKFAEPNFESVKARLAGGKATSEELRTAEAERDIAKIELEEAQAKAKREMPKSNAATTNQTTNLAAAFGLEKARQDLANVRKLVELGQLAPQGNEMLLAESTVAILEAEIKGDTLAAAKARLEYATKFLRLTRKLREVGKATDHQVETAVELEATLRTALAELEKKP